MTTKKKRLLQRQIDILKQIISVLKKLLTLEFGKNEKDFHAFADALGRSESGGNYQAVNPYGYLGKYQFGLARLCDLGYTKRKPEANGYHNKAFEWKDGLSRQKFLNDRDLQDRVFKEHVRALIKTIRDRFSEHIGATVRGISITLSGLVAMAHLSGVEGVSNFLIHGVDSQDAFGTKATDYLRKFGGYRLDIYES